MKPLTPASPHAIIMMGIPGAGKSAFAEKFADTFQAPILNRIKLQQELGLDTAQINKLSDLILEEYLKTHRTILIEGDADQKSKRDELTKKLQKAGYRALFVWVQTDTNESHRRATKPYPKGSGLSSEDFDELVAQFEPPHPKENAIVISGKHTYATQLIIVLKQLAQHSTPQGPTGPQSHGRSVLIR